MPYTDDYGSRSNWSAVLDGFVQLVQIATAAVTAKVLQDPDARATLNRGYVVPYAADHELRQRSYHRFNQRMEQIAVQYGELRTCFESMHVELRFSRTEAHSLGWEQARQLDLAHDCLAFDRSRQQITYYLTQCAIMHAEMVCAVTEYLENIHTAYVCPPNYCNPGIQPFGDIPDPQQRQQFAERAEHAETAQQAGNAQQAERAQSAENAPETQHAQHARHTEDDREQPGGGRGRRTTRS